MEAQSKLTQIFQIAKEKNRFANAYLLVGENANRYPTKIVSMITDEKQRVESNNYQDYIAFESDLKKEDVLKLQQYFSKKPAEKLNKKIYSILNVERASIAALNALLKFLEEPVSDTIAILTCASKENVLPTILSRCSVIQLDAEAKKHSETTLELYEKVKNIEDIDLFFITLHQEAKNVKYEDYFDLYQLLIELFKSNYKYYSAFVMIQNEFEKSCNISLVLDHTLYLIKK